VTMNNTENYLRVEDALDGMRVAMREIRDRLVEGLQLTRTQLEILIVSAKGSPTTGELARCLSLTLGAVTQTVDTLVRRELIERYPDDLDRRIVRLKVTGEGKKIAANLNELRRSNMQSLIDTLTSEEIELLITVAGKMKHLLEATPTIKNVPAAGEKE
jgi:DNA-binding MarR family transcriptional regulator